MRGNTYIFNLVSLFLSFPAVGGGALSDAAISLSVCLSHLGQLGAQRLGPATRAVRTADPSAHGRRSAAIGGRHIVSPRDNLFFVYLHHVYDLPSCTVNCTHGQA